MKATLGPELLDRGFDPLCKRSIKVIKLLFLFKLCWSDWWVGEVVFESSGFR